MKRILLTGSRDWTDRSAMEVALRIAVRDLWDGKAPILVHGGAPGADTMAGEIWEGWVVAHGFPKAEVHEANWAELGKGAGPVRNAYMVSLGADLCLAFPLGRSPGTRDCMERAMEAGIPVRPFGVAPPLVRPTEPPTAHPDNIARAEAYRVADWHTHAEWLAEQIEAQAERGAEWPLQRIEIEMLMWHCLQATPSARSRPDVSPYQALVDLFREHPDQRQRILDLHTDHNGRCPKCSTGGDSSAKQQAPCLLRAAALRALELEDA